MVDQSLGSKVVAKELILQSLLSEASIVGGVFTMGYEECLILTNDLWKKAVGGVSQHCFLLAAAMDQGTAPDPDDEEVILLRVVGPCPLPVESQLIQVRADAMRDIITNYGAAEAASPSAILDVLTRNEIQFSGLKAKVLGTFYESEINGYPILGFGSDVESFYSSSRYKVFKPYGPSLEKIACFPEVTEAEELLRQAGAAVYPRIPIGSVRYSSSNRRRRLSAQSGIDTAVPVRINVEDFISMKTAIFGMTRLGKSNTMKTIATAISEYAANTDQLIGQLLFDPAGEYANVNVQDQTALSQIGEEFVVIYRYGADGSSEQTKPLATNFYSQETIELTWTIIRQYLLARNQSGYVQSFTAADVIGPENPDDDRSAHKRALRRRSALFACLKKANFKVPSGWRTPVPMNKDLRQQVNNARDATKVPDEFQADGQGNVWLTENSLPLFWDTVLRAPATPELAEWKDSELDAILTVYSGSVGRGYRLLEGMRSFHLESNDYDYAEEVLKDLIEGRIVIVDLSFGTDAVLRFSSERIVLKVLEEATRRFSGGLEPHLIQIYIEEAHKLFSRDRMSGPEERDPYVRLAKEAAKYKLGLIYATQEVSEVDSQILANTSNWIVTHLNNHSEVRELSKYYDFADFAELTIRAEDVGFTRLKTRSGKFIVPTQIDKFTESKVLSAREACLQSMQRREAKAV